MILYNLIAILQEIAETEGGADVQIATQPRHPLAFTLGGVHYDDATGRVWLAVGDHAEDPYSVPEEVWS